MSQVSSIVFFIVLAFHFHHSDQMKVTHGNAHSSNRIQTQLYNLLDCTTIYYLIVTRSSLYFSFSWTFVMHHNISSPTTLCELSRQQSKSLLCWTPHDNPKFPVDLSQVHSTNKFLLCRDLLKQVFKVFKYASQYLFSPLGKALPPPHTLPSSTRLVSSLSSSPSPPHLLPLPGNQLAFKWFRSNKEYCKVLNKTKHLVTFVTFASLATVQTVWNGDHRPKSSGI